MYKISFTDKNSEEFFGTIEHFTTDGRYNFNSILDIAMREKNRSLKSNLIKGFNVRKYSFNGPVIKSYKF